MSFCTEVKNEIAESVYGDCCNASHLYGILSFAKSFGRDGVSLHAGGGAVARHIIDSFRAFGVPLGEDVTELRGGTHILRISDPEIADRLLSDFGYSGSEPSYRIKAGNFMCERCRGAFAAGCFLTGGTVSRPANWYHLEFSGHRLRLLADFAELLQAEGFSPKIAERRPRKRVVYFKDSAQIEDLLTYIGAPVSAMEIMEVKIEKDIINNVNRRTNCENANIDKTVLASEADGRLISRLFRLRGEDCLPDDLLEVARLRLDYPELSIAELGELTERGLGKSGVSHRLRKIRTEARQLTETSHNGD